MNFGQELSATADELRELRADLTELRQKTSTFLAPAVYKTSDYPGPGSYNIESPIGQKCSLAHKQNSRQVSIAPPSIEFVSTLESPSAHSYYPNYSFVSTPSKAPHIVPDGQKRLTYIKELSKRSPGPVYHLPTPKSTSYSFNSARKMPKLGSRWESPAPNQYEVQKASAYLKKYSGLRFKTSLREQFNRLVDANRVSKGTLGPGPIYSPKSVVRRSKAAILSGAIRWKPESHSEAPAVGTYSPVNSKPIHSMRFATARRF